MIILALIISLGMAGVLLWAGLEKIRDLNVPIATMRSLGVPGGLAGSTACLLAFTEIGVAFGLIFEPWELGTQMGVLVLALAFALAGFYGTLQSEPIRCNCFGSGGNGELGRNQIIALLPWLVGISVLYLGKREPLDLEAGAFRLSAIGIILATLQAIRVWRSQREARGDRLSAMEMYLWSR